MKYLKLIFVSFFVFCSLQSHAQKEELYKSLETYEKATSLNEKIDIFFFFHSKFEQDMKDSVLYYVDELQRLGIKNNNEAAVAMANYGVAPYLISQSLFDDANEKLKKAERYYQKVQNDTMLAVVYTYLGNSSYLQGNLIQAEMLYNKSAEYAKHTGLMRFQLISSFNLARIHINQKKYDKAKDMIQTYIDFMLKTGDMRKLAAAYGLMGQLYIDQGNTEEAIQSFTRSMETGLSAGSMVAVANGYTNLGIAEYFRENYSKSEQYFKLALAYREKEGDKFFIAEGYYNLGDFYYGIEKLDSAKLNYLKSLEIAKASNNLPGQKDALEQLDTIYAMQKDTESQINTLKEIIKTQKLLSEKQSFDEIVALRRSFEQSKRDAINTVGIREDQLQGKVANYQSLFSNWMWVVLACIIGLSIFFLYFRKTKKK